MNEPKYSKEERILINSLTEDGNRLMSIASHPPRLYRLLAIECFINDRTGPEVEALKRVLRAFERLAFQKYT